MDIYIFKSNRIKELRKKRGLTGKKLAELIKKTPAAISKIESGKRNPSAIMLGKIAGALEVSPKFFYEKESQVKDPVSTICPICNGYGCDQCNDGWTTI